MIKTVRLGIFLVFLIHYVSANATSKRGFLLVKTDIPTSTSSSIYIKKCKSISGQDAIVRNCFDTHKQAEINPNRTTSLETGFYRLAANCDYQYNCASELQKLVEVKEDKTTVSVINVLNNETIQKYIPINLAQYKYIMSYYIYRDYGDSQMRADRESEIRWKQKKEFNFSSDIKASILQIYLDKAVYFPDSASGVNALPTTYSESAIRFFELAKLPYSKELSIDHYDSDGVLLDVETVFTSGELHNNSERLEGWNKFKSIHFNVESKPAREFVVVDDYGKDSSLNKANKHDFLFFPGKYIFKSRFNCYKNWECNVVLDNITFEIK